MEVDLIVIYIEVRDWYLRNNNVIIVKRDYDCFRRLFWVIKV